MITTVNELNIVLGDNCNLNCNYCNFHLNKTNKKHELTFNEDIIKFILESPILSKEKLLIKVWGGEPLLYWNHIRRLVNTLKDDRIKFLISSNGVALSENHVEFINSRNITFVLSHDGPNTLKTRNYDVLKSESFLNLFNFIEHKGINTVYSAYSQDLYPVWKYFESLFHNINLSTEFLLNRDGMPSDIYNFDLNIVSNFLDKASSKIIKLGFDSDDCNNEINFFKSMIYRVVKYNLDSSISPISSCNMMDNRLAINIEGDILSCQGSDHNLQRNIHDSFDDIVKAYKEYIPNLYHYEECKTCSFHNYCRGHCNEYRKQTYNDIICSVRKNIINSAIKIINNYKYVKHECTCGCGGHHHNEKNKENKKQ